MLKSLKGSNMLNDAPGRGLQDRVCVKSLLAFFFNRGARGGPRIFINLAMGMVVLLIIARLMPQRMSESAFGSISQNLWGAIGGDQFEDDGSVPGGLRIVIFGENDIATPVGFNGEYEGAAPWTEVLCAELECSSHISMVPNTDAGSWSVSSNELYAIGVEAVINATQDRTGPGWDYSYLQTFYPTQWDGPDLKDQITQFLSMPKPRHPPRETLWVFSFGVWDVWSLAALPIPVGEQSVKDMTEDIFNQVERLYTASMDSSSIAWSDINTIVKSPSHNNTDEDGNVAAKRDEEAAKSETSPTESFRILIPRIVDPSMLPGWRDLRPILPPVHSKAEQMRNAAELTEYWNNGVVTGLNNWVKKENPKPTDEKKEENVRAPTAAPASSPDEAKRTDPIPAINPRAAEPVAEATAPKTPEVVEDIVYPQRDGFAYNLADYVLDQLVERQLKNAKQKDAVGLGNRPEELGFRVVNSACVQPISTVPVSVSVASDVTLNIPNSFVGKDIQVPTPPSPISTGLDQKQKSKQSSRREDAESEAEAEVEVEVEKRQVGGSKMEAVRVCNIPSEHLFYTPFTLSQTAISAIASQVADMVRKNQTVRVKQGLHLAAVGRPKVSTPPAHALTGES